MGGPFGGKRKFKNPFSGLFAPKKKRVSILGKRSRTIGERVHIAAKHGARIVRMVSTIGGRVQLAASAGLGKKRVSLIGGTKGGQSHAKDSVRRTGLTGNRKGAYVPRFFGNQYIQIAPGGRSAKRSSGQKASLLGKK